MSFLAYFDMGLVVNVAVFLFTMIFRQKILDWFNGVPAHMRSALNTVETGVMSQVTAFEIDLMARIVPAVGKPMVAPSPPAPVAAPSPAAILPEVHAPAPAAPPAA
jgi:hypothetical protein